MKKNCLVVLSGGQDSVTCLYWAKANYTEVRAITFNYNQRHLIEIESARKTAEMAGVEHEIIDVPSCLVSASPLTSGNSLEKYSKYSEMDNIIGDRRELTFVPMRNALFLTIAANRAEAYEIDTIATGVCQMDNENYDDCRKVFLNVTEQYINTALGHDHRGTGWIKLEAPLLYLTKEESIYFAEKYGAMDALAYSHTCYAGEYPPCGKCHSCILRAEGFKNARVADPIFNRGN